MSENKGFITLNLVNGKKTRLFWQMVISAAVCP